MKTKITLKNVGNLTKYKNDHIISFTGINALKRPYKKINFEGDYPRLSIGMSSNGCVLYNTFRFDTKEVFFTFPEGEKRLSVIIRIFTSQTNFLIKSDFNKIICAPTPADNESKDILLKLGFELVNGQYIFQLKEQNECFNSLKKTREECFHVKY